MKRDQPVSAAVASAVVAVILGAMFGYGFRYWTEESKVPDRRPAASQEAAGSSAAGSSQNLPRMLTAPAFGPNVVSLVRTIRAMEVIERVQGQAMTPAQRSRLNALLKELKESPKLDDENARKVQARILSTLTDAQRAAIASLQPRRESGSGGAARGIATARTDGDPPAQPLTDDSPFTGGRARTALLTLLGEGASSR